MLSRYRGTMLTMSVHKRYRARLVIEQVIQPYDVVPTEDVIVHRSASVVLGREEFGQALEGDLTKLATRVAQSTRPITDAARVADGGGLELWGHKAEVILQLAIGEGRTVTVPITQHCERAHFGRTAELTVRIPVYEAQQAIDDATYRGLDR